MLKRLYYCPEPGCGRWGVLSISDRDNQYCVAHGPMKELKHPDRIIVRTREELEQEKHASDPILQEAASIMGDRPCEEIIRSTTEKYLPNATANEPICWSCGHAGGEMNQYGGIFIHRTKECRAIAGQEDEETEVNERDTKFAGFASALLKEIDDAIGRQTKESQEQGLSDKDEKRFANELGVIITRRAYDFACHVINHVSQADAEFREGKLQTAQEIAEDIPDLVELPEGEV